MFKTMGLRSRALGAQELRYNDKKLLYLLTNTRIANREITKVLLIHVLLNFLFPDEDECSDPSRCLHGVCQNYRGGYQCLCNPGFVVTEDMKDCVGQCYNTIFLITG